jgi:hypothetical protein
MRKTKIYIGRNKGIDKFGRNKLKKVPSVLKNFFLLQMRRWAEVQQLKISMNSTIGMASKALEPKGYESALERRVGISKRFHSGGYHGGMV